MKKFKVFRNTKGEAHAIKAGWCWPAFFFSFIWAVVSGMWVLGLGVFFTYAVFKALVGPSAVAEFYFSMILFITKIIFAINGNEWRAKSLVSKGFEFEKMVEAEDKESAVQWHTKALKPSQD